MKGRRLIFDRWYRMVLGLAVVMVGVSGLAHGQVATSALLIQQTPADGGVITPDIGVHKFGQNSEVSLRAIANPGYQFVYWIGDVSDATASSTVTYLDSPKIVIAVFERVGYEYLSGASEEVRSTFGPGLYRGGSYSNQGYTGGGAKRPRKWRWPTPPIDDDDDDDDDDDKNSDDLPVPQDDNDLPVPDEPIPEPATGLLLMLGCLVGLKGRRTKK